MYVKIYTFKYDFLRLNKKHLNLNYHTPIKTEHLLTFNFVEKFTLLHGKANSGLLVINCHES